MWALTKTHHTDGTHAEIMLTVPIEDADKVAKAIESLLILSGHTIDHFEEEGFLSIAEVFPNASPGMALRGLRVREDITQKELAERLDIAQNMVSEMENNKRPITVKMAKMIDEVFDIPYKIFL